MKFFSKKNQSHDNHLEGLRKASLISTVLANLNIHSMVQRSSFGTESLNFIYLSLGSIGHPRITVEH